MTLPDDLLIFLSRGPCFGNCPVYSVGIVGDGTVSYHGRDYVRVKGRQTASIAAADVAALLARFDAIGFDQLPERYEASISDLPQVTITLRRDGTAKTVVDYGGHLAGMPEAVTALEAEIDRVAGTARWVGPAG